MQRSDALNTSGDSEHPLKKMLMICDQAITENLPFFMASRSGQLNLFLENLIRKIYNPKHDNFYKEIKEEIKNIVDIERQFNELVDKYFREFIFKLFPDGNYHLKNNKEKRNEVILECSSRLKEFSANEKNRLHLGLSDINLKIATLYKSKKKSQIKIYSFFLNPDLFHDKINPDEYFIIVRDLFICKKIERSTDEQEMKLNKIKENYKNKVTDLLSEFYLGRFIFTVGQYQSWMMKHQEEKTVLEVDQWMMEKKILACYERYHDKNRMPGLVISDLIIENHYKNLMEVMNNNYDEVIMQYRQEVEADIQAFCELIEKQWKDKIKELEELMLCLIDEQKLKRKGLRYFYRINENIGVGHAIIALCNYLCLENQDNKGMIKKSKSSSFSKIFNVSEYVESSYQTHPLFYVESYKRADDIIRKLIPAKAEKENLVKTLNNSVTSEDKILQDDINKRTKFLEALDELVTVDFPGQLSFKQQIDMKQNVETIKKMVMGEIKETDENIEKYINVIQIESGLWKLQSDCQVLPALKVRSEEMHPFVINTLKILSERMSKLKLEIEKSFRIQIHTKQWLEIKRLEIDTLKEDIKKTNEQIAIVDPLYTSIKALCEKLGLIHQPSKNHTGLAELIDCLKELKQTLELEMAQAEIKKSIDDLIDSYDKLPTLIESTATMHRASLSNLKRLKERINKQKPDHSKLENMNKEAIAHQKRKIARLAADINEANAAILAFETLRAEVYALYIALNMAVSELISNSETHPHYNYVVSYDCGATTEIWGRTCIAELTQLFDKEKTKLLTEKKRLEEAAVKEECKRELEEKIKVLKETEKQAQAEVDVLKEQEEQKRAIWKEAKAKEEEAKLELEQSKAEAKSKNKADTKALYEHDEKLKLNRESQLHQNDKEGRLVKIKKREKVLKKKIAELEAEIERLKILEKGAYDLRERIRLEQEKIKARALLTEAQESEAKAKEALAGAVAVEGNMKAEAEEEKRLKEEEEKALREAREKEVRLQAVLDEAVKVAGEKEEGVDIKVRKEKELLLEVGRKEEEITEYQEAIASIEAATLASLHKELSDAQELEVKAKAALKGAVAAETKAKTALAEAAAEKTKAATVVKDVTEEGKKEERLSAILKAAREEERKAEEVLAKLKEKEAEQLAKVKEAIEAAEKISQRQKRQEKRLAKEAKRQAKLSELQTKIASLSPQLMTITDNMHLASKARLKHLNQKIQTMDQLELNALPLRAVKTMLAEVTALAAEIKEANETIDAVEKLKVDLIKLRQATSRSHEGYVEIGDLAQLKKALEAEKAKIEEEEKAREAKVAILAGKRAALTSPMAATAVIAPACQAYLGELAERYRQEQEKGKSDAYVSIEEVNAQIEVVDLLAEAITQAPEEIKAVQALLTEVKELEEAKLIPAQDAASIQNMKELKRALESVKQRGMLALNAEIEIVEKKREALKEELNKLAQDYACLNRKTDDASIAYVEMLKIHQAVCKETLETLEAIEIKQDSPLAENAGKITKLREEMERINYVLKRSEAKREEYLEGMVQTYNEKIANLSEDKTYQALNKQIEELEKEYQTLSEEGLKDKETKAYLSYLKAECDRRRNAAEGMLDDHKYINLNSGVLTIGKVLEREQGIEDQKAVLVHLFSERQAIDARRKHYEEAKERIGLLEALTRYRKMMETFVWQRTEAPLESVSKLIHPCEEYAELDKTRLNKKRIKGGSGQGVIPLGKIKSKETSLLEATTTINEKAVPQSSLFSQRGGRQQVSADRKPVTTTMHRLDMEKATQAALTENKKPIKPREAKIEKKIRKDIADCQSRIKSFEEEMDVAVVLQIPLMFLKWTGITQERDKPLAERSIGYLKQKVGEAEEIIWKITEINAVDPLSIYVPPAIDDDKFVYEAPPSPVLSPSPLTLFSKKGKKQDLSIAEMPKQSVAKSKHANGIGRSQGIRALEERIRKLEVEIKMSKWESYTESQTHRREMKAAWDTLLEEMKAVLESIQALEEEGQNIILLPGQKENTYKVLLVSVFATVRQETYSTEDKHLSKYLVEIDERHQQSLSSKYQHIQFS